MIHEFVDSASPRASRRDSVSLSSDDNPVDAGLAADSSADGAYSEEAFRYFLEIERRRAEVSCRPLLLLLLDLKKQGSPDGYAIPAAVATKLFSSLTLCLRDTDFVGWYRDGRVAGAVLTQNAETTDTGIADLIAQRVTTALKDTLPEEVSIRIQVRVYQVPSPAAR